MKREAELHAEEDRKRKELIEARNNADNAAYTAEKFLRENGDKIGEAEKTGISEKVAQLREAMNGEDAANIRRLTEELGQEIQRIGATMYQQAGGDQAASGTAGAGGSSDGGGKEGPSDEDIVDGEFKNV